MLGPLPRLSAFSSSIASGIWKNQLKKPDGTLYAVWDQFSPWCASLGVQRDKLNETRIFANDLKGDSDEHAARLNDIEHRVAALEAQPVTRFP